MAENSEITVRLFASGYCEANNYVVNKTGFTHKTRFYAVWALLYFPNIGYVMFDTGYSEAFNKATQLFPERLYRWATPVKISPNQTAKAIIENLDIQVDEIKYVIISHFHADHIAGLKDFPHSQFICSKIAYEEVINLKGFKAVFRGILHQLLPIDFKLRLKFIEDFADSIFTNKYGMTSFKLFGNSSCTFVTLPGHSKGMLGFIYENKFKSLFYATDASWNYDSFSKGILPLKIVNIFFDSWQEYVETQQKIRMFENENKHFKILLTHCKRTLAHIDNDI
jgi:glyoxylase-like metal-dependent hydrolase (beta-lactamase superfamily II)